MIHWMTMLVRRRAVAVAAASLLLSTSILPASWAQEQGMVETAETPQGTIDDVADYLKTGQYEAAVEVLRRIIDEASGVGDFATLRRAYLLLIKTYTLRGNFYESENDQTSADLYHKEARSLVTECLQVPELRSTSPESQQEYPPEMHEMFDDVRTEIFGSFRVIGLQPPDAFVVLDGDTLSTLPNEEFLGDVDIPIGSHEIVVASEGYRTINDSVIVTPGVTLERSYQLMKPRGKWWYVGWGSLAAAGATGLVWALTGQDPPPPDPEPLPGPPAPPN